ncbi:MAG: hypothetical protein ABIC04_08280 [Nanoarchaeota archaeon]
MKVAVCGSGTCNDISLLNEIKLIGREIAVKGAVLLTGGCRGYPYAALRGALLENGKVVVYSPAKNETEHIEKYNFPIDSGVVYIYTGLGIPERNLELVKNADIVVIVDGRIGTLNEFTIAFHLQKRIFVLKKPIGILQLIPKIAELCNKNNEKKNISYFENNMKFKLLLN